MSIENTISETEVGFRYKFFYSSHFISKALGVEVKCSTALLEVESSNPGDRKFFFNSFKKITFTGTSLAEVVYRKNLMI